MNFLLINPNRYRHPPVPPIGLEHTAGVIEKLGQRAEILDLCFSSDPVSAVDRAVAEFAPDIAGFTIRNIDTALFHTSEFFLDDIKELINHVKTVHGLKVIIGGAGVGTDPEGLCAYLGADSAVSGPSEGAVEAIVSDLISGSPLRRSYAGKYSFNPVCPRSRRGVDYGKYLELGGIAGFHTHKGCSSSCIYCIEARTAVSFRNPDEVVSELKSFAEDGIEKFHLCDPEFNEDADFCMDFLSSLKSSGLRPDWAVYMKPAYFNRKLMKLMKETGVSLITLSVDSWKKCTVYNEEIEKYVFGAKSAGIKIVVDFLTGFPYEDEETVMSFIEMFKRLEPDGVGVNTYLRLYKNLRLTEMIMRDPMLEKQLVGDFEDGSFRKPVFYNRIDSEKMMAMIDGDQLFRIVGETRGVNYERKK